MINSGWSVGGHSAVDQLREAVSDVCGKGVLTTKSLGRMLSYRVGRVVNGKRLKFEIDRHSKVKKWFVEPFRN